MRKYLAVNLILITLLAALSSTHLSFANHGQVLHNATEQNSGNWYGTYAQIAWTDPNLRTGSGGQWAYHRTSANHTCCGAHRYSEIGWTKGYGVSGIRGLIVWDSGSNRQELTFSITAATHTYQQQYWNNGGDRYVWYVDGGNLGNGATNFSYTTTVTCGGEVAKGIEAMGNTLCSSNKKLIRDAGGNYSYISWGSHTNYVDDAPYTNVNSSSDPNNAFYSTGNE